MSAEPIKNSKIRLDKLLVDRGLVPSRERAQSLILAGKVLVNEQKIDKSGAAIDPDSTIRLLGDDLKYVSRGGLKLEKALQHWQIGVRGKTCLDVGASTGGFIDCLLQHGASRVFAIDTGYGQLDFRLRNDPRVRLLEKTNARYLSADQLKEVLEAVDNAAPRKEQIDLIVMDVSFISATLVLPAVIAAALPVEKASRSGRQIIVLVKPQFEAGRDHVGKGGIVRDQEAQLDALEKVRQCLLAQGCTRTDSLDSPILGAEGNREFLLLGVF